MRSIVITIVRWSARSLSAIMILFHVLSFLGDPDMAGLGAGDQLKVGLWALSLVGLLAAWRWEGAGSLMIIGVTAVQFLLNPILLSMWAAWIAPFTGLLFATCAMATRRPSGAAPGVM